MKMFIRKRSLQRPVSSLCRFRRMRPARRPSRTRRCSSRTRCSCAQRPYDPSAGSVGFKKSKTQQTGPAPLRSQRRQRRLQEVEEEEGEEVRLLRSANASLRVVVIAGGPGATGLPQARSSIASPSEGAASARWLLVVGSADGAGAAARAARQSNQHRAGYRGFLKPW